MRLHHPGKFHSNSLWATNTAYTDVQIRYNVLSAALPMCLLLQIEGSIFSRYCQSKQLPALSAQHPTAHALVVSHGGLIRCLLNHLKVCSCAGCGGCARVVGVVKSLFN